ncbi:MAG TPA: hypothetical protein DG761_08855 [Gammaproteobacteria bacterium]|nr:hypothetical protein [Gammaproteobacteria bacterium]
MQPWHLPFWHWAISRSAGDCSGPALQCIGQIGALRILAELVVLPQDMQPAQWVAHAGLDPRPYASATSIHPPRKITKVGNRFLRTALYMPALVAIRHQPQVNPYSPY